MKGENDSKNDGGVPTICERSIWKFYEWAVVLAPLSLMLSHWYIFWVFSQNTHELMHYSEANEICIAWIYSILYLYVPLMLLPASYFFKWCNLFRIPFGYFILINVERWYYGAWFCTNEMIDTHYFLIYCTICAYIGNLIFLGFKYKKDLPKYLGQASLYIAKRYRSLFIKHNIKNAKYNKIMNILEKTKYDEIQRTVPM